MIWTYLDKVELAAKGSCWGAVALPWCLAEHDHDKAYQGCEGQGHGRDDTRESADFSHDCCGKRKTARSCVEVFVWCCGTGSRRWLMSHSERTGNDGLARVEMAGASHGSNEQEPVGVGTSGGNECSER